jgi:threonylcarbamoyladenosine tRNA methylthiotransferase MtaB
MERVRVSINTFGCRVNQYDSEMMRTLLAPTCDITDDEPDLVLLNACTVTALAERKARQAARRIRRRFPAARIVVIGCLADAVEQGTTTFQDADLLAGNGWKPRIGDVVEQAVSGARGALPHEPFRAPCCERSAGPADRIRAFLKIQDGCDHACTYCRATQVRGPSRSKPFADAVQEAQALLSAGFPEIVLTGIDLAQYAASGVRLAGLLEAIASLDGLQRLRIASINLSGMSQDVIEVCSRNKLVSPHFHIPLQSGDDRILAAMERGHTVGTYLETIDRIRTRMPHATFGTDLIVGFPGEDDDAFSSTCRVVDEVGFTNLHIFRFSPRLGTAAAALPHPTPPEIKRLRSERLLARWEKTLPRTLDNRIGSTQDVLVEESREGGWRGYTHDYLYVKFPSDQELLIGTITSVRITGRTASALEGVNHYRIDTR